MCRTTSRRLLQMHTGNLQPIRPSLGSWLLYGLGTENENLPGYVVLRPSPKIVVGPALWSNSFLPGGISGDERGDRGHGGGEAGREHSQSASRLGASSASNSICSAQLNRRHLEQRNGRRGTEWADRGDGNRLSHAEAGDGDLRHQPRTGVGARSLRRHAFRALVPAGAPAGRRRRALRHGLLHERQQQSAVGHARGSRCAPSASSAPTPTRRRPR